MNSNLTFNCFGLVIHGYGKPEILAYVRDAVRQGRQTMIVTANPENLIFAKTHPEYWNVLRQADLRTVDSFGLVCAGLLHSVKPHRTPGVELADYLCEEAEKNGWRVGLIGGAEGIADKAAWSLRQRYPQLNVVAEAGGRVDADGNGDEANDEAIFRLTQSAPDILLVALSFPGQEAWIAKHISDIPSVKVAIGVGGTLDYWSGKIKRAPSWMRKLGLEWLYRLILEPRRWKRMFTAVIVFPLMAFFDRFRIN
ncbi:MAG: WecB/TagA/CpsF family glycosyltransferase [Patescibacteria group bacterium]|nr:WecB/TagA/CpsF family glycosyltransferase [Patescibacteria group bacterium]